MYTKLWSENVKGRTTEELEDIIKTVITEVGCEYMD